MRAAVYHSNEDIRIVEMPVPEISAEEMLVRVHACGICGSDVLEWYRKEGAPRVLGHEAAGEVVRVGEDVQAHEVGERVFISHHVPCGACRYCRKGHQTVCDMLRTTNIDPGGFAEYIRVPAVNVERGVYPLPDTLSFDEGVFVEPLGCVLRGQRAVALGEDDCVLVVGSGLTGILHIQVARVEGASCVFASDILDSRLDAARRFGADAVLRSSADLPERLREANGGRGADVVLICTGAASAIETAVRCVDRGGRVLFFAPTTPGTGIALPFNDLWREEVTLTSTYGAAPEDLSSAVEMLARRRVNVLDMITHRLPLEDTGRGFMLTADGRGSLKVVVHPGE